MARGGVYGLIDNDDVSLSIVSYSNYNCCSEQTDAREQDQGKDDGVVCLHEGSS